VPDGKVGHDAFAVIRETSRTMDKVAIARVVLTNREHIIALLAVRAWGMILGKINLADSSLHAWFALQFVSQFGACLSPQLTII
jgi:non-homologous end joining protein Ku